MILAKAVDFCVKKSGLKSAQLLFYAKIKLFFHFNCTANGNGFCHFYGLIFN